MIDRRRIDPDSRRFFEGALAMLGLTLLVVSLSLIVVRAAHGQALVDMTRYDATHGKQEIACYLDSLQYTQATAIIHCHSDLDRIFVNGFEALP